MRPWQSRSEREQGEERESGLPPFAWEPVLAVAAGCFLLLMLVAGRYGYHRDELYFVAASRHMAWGYVDQPPLTVALVWLARHLFGDSLYGLRVFPAMAYATAVVAHGPHGPRIRRPPLRPESRRALARRCRPFLSPGTWLGPTVYDLAFWAVAARLVMRILRTGGRGCGCSSASLSAWGCYTKETILFLVSRLAVGLLANRRWSVLGSP